jgi:hypothetical protein
MQNEKICMASAWLGAIQRTRSAKDTLVRSETRFPTDGEAGPGALNIAFQWNTPAAYKQKRWQTRD